MWIRWSGKRHGLYTMTTLRVQGRCPSIYSITLCMSMPAFFYLTLARFCCFHIELEFLGFTEWSRVYDSCLRTSIMLSAPGAFLFFSFLFLFSVFFASYPLFILHSSPRLSSRDKLICPAKDLADGQCICPKSWQGYSNSNKIYYKKHRRCHHKSRVKDAVKHQMAS